MELKVWVDGVVRVVCGLSEETSCQDVVITLAQAMGQTGRYVLIQRLRDNDRQLLANEKLLESMTKLGQKASDIQFFLRRIGPSNQDIAVLDKGIVCPKQLPKDSFSSLTKKKTSVSTPLPGSSAGVSKDELFQQVLQQQTRLHALEVQLEALDREVLVWEQMTAPSYQPLEEKLEAKLEKMLYAENDQELESNCKLRELHRVLDSYDNRLRDLTAHSERLQQEMQLENIRQQPVVAQSSLEESLGSVEVQLESQWKHGEELESSLSEIEEALGGAEALLQAKTEQLDKLNKELRRCNLQQFIQQTGTHMHADLEHLEKTERMHRLPNGCCNGPGSCHTELPARSTARQFLGHPRNLLNPRISSLNPEGVFV